MTDDPTAGVVAGHANGPSLEPVQQMDHNLFGVAVFITSEAIFFLTLIIAYVVYHGHATSGPGPKDVLDIPYTAVFTVFLLSSSITMALVTARLHENDAAGVRRWLIATIALGAVFLAGQGYEYYHLYADNVTISRNLWGSTFFTLTGFHGLHVLVGLIAMAILVGLVAPSSERPHAGSGVEAVSIYWHFVDAVWVIIFSVIYLWTLIS